MFVWRRATLGPESLSLSLSLVSFLLMKSIFRIGKDTQTSLTHTGMRSGSVLPLLPVWTRHMAAPPVMLCNKKECRLVDEGETQTVFKEAGDAPLDKGSSRKSRHKRIIMRTS